MYEKKWIDRGACPKCNSSDANVQHLDGHSFCFSCNTRFGKPQNKKEKVVTMQTNTRVTGGEIEAIPERGITKETAQKYQTLVKKNGSIVTHHLYKYFNAEGSYVADKIRQVDIKRIWSQGNIEDALLFGQNLFKSGGKYITICEGELDAMSAHQMMDSKWPCVSIKNGVNSALENCRDVLEYLNSFENIVLCFDNDKVGKEASQKTAHLFEPNKCKIVNLTLKDPNEYLKMGREKQFKDEWWEAETYTPAGITNLGKLGSSLYEENYCETVPYPWNNMNEKTYGMRTGELVTFTSGAGMGKSSIMRELMYHIMNNTLHNIGVVALEESIKNTAFNIMSVEANQRLYIKEIRDKFSKEQLKEWEEKTIGTERFFAFDHWGSITNDEILSRIRYMAKALECRWIILDHLSILISGRDEVVDERRSIDSLMTKLRSLVEETDIGLLLVSHLRRPSGDRGHEDGREISLSHLRGSASIAHLSDSVIALERNQQAEDDAIANTTTIRVLKNRYTGDTGITCYLHYNKETGRMTQIDNPYDDGDL